LRLAETPIQLFGRHKEKQLTHVLLHERPQKFTAQNYRKKTAVSVTSPWRNVDFEEPWFELVVEQDVKTKQFVAAIATPHAGFHRTTDVRLRADAPQNIQTPVAYQKCELKGARLPFFLLSFPFRFLPFFSPFLSSLPFPFPFPFPLFYSHPP